MKFNVSQIRTHLECPQKSYFANRLRRVPHKKPLAPEVGICWHLAMEAFLKTKSKDDGIDAVAQYLLETGEDPKVISGWSALEPAYLAWSWPDEWELLAVEQLVEHKFTQHLTIQGRLDGLVKWNSQYWHLQHKTLAPSTPVHVYAAYIQRDWHECWYEFACREQGYVPFGGTILNLVRKLSAKTIAENPSAAISVQYIPRSKETVERAMADLYSIGSNILYDIGVHIENRSVCAGRYGNSLCAYIDVCNGIERITNDELFTDAPDRYSEPDVPLSALTE